MQEVKVHKDRLMDKLKVNREKHRDDFTDLRGKYLEKLDEVLHDALTEVHREELPALLLPEKPVSHASDYDKAIKMVEMSVETVIKLTEHEFSQLVMDEWSWSQRFELTKTAYGV